MDWKIGDAKRQFTKVVRAAQGEPQWIYRRQRLVAGVVDAETLEDYLAWREVQERPTLADAFAELRSLCADEPGAFAAVERRDRDKGRPG